MADNIPTADQSANAPAPTILSGGASQPAMPIPDVGSPTGVPQASAPAAPDQQYLPDDANAAAARAGYTGPGMKPGLDLNTPPPAPGPAKPGLWAAILQGALNGLAGSAGAKHFGGGLGLGAENAIVEPQKEAALAADIKFKSVQAADLLVQARVHQKQLDNLPQEQQDEHNTKNLEILEHLKTLIPGLQFTATENSPAAVTAALASETKTQGGVPEAVHLNVGGQVYSIRMDQLNGPPGLDLVNNMLRNQGIPENRMYNSATWAGLDTATKTNLLNQSVHFENPIPNEDNLKTYQNYLTTATENKNDSAVKLLTPIVARLQTGVDKENARAAAQAGAVKGAEKAAEEPYMKEDRIFQTQLQEKKAALDRAGANEVAKNTEANKLLVAEDNKLSDTLSLSQDIRGQLDLSKGGNQQASQDVWTAFAAHELKSHGVNRITSAELKNLGPSVGSLVRQIQVGGDKALQGKIPNVSAGDIGAILDLEDNEARQTHAQHVANIDRDIRGRTTSAPASRSGQKDEFGGVIR